MTWQLSANTRSRAGAAISGAVLLASGACGTSGSAWMAEPLPRVSADLSDADFRVPQDEARGLPRGGTPAAFSGPRSIDGLPDRESEPLGGRKLGVFRNTYYDFPSERDFEGSQVAVKDRNCKTIRQVPRGFYEALCVQGSGMLASGLTVSFARRDCECAEICPRTDQKICFDELRSSEFPWGRGAMGKAITPLLTVATDPAVIPMGTALYIPEYEGMPRDLDGRTSHDGCFIAQDRGLKVQGQHVDVFTGLSALTRVWNERVPSNLGVTVILDHPRCERASVPSSP